MPSEWEAWCARNVDEAREARDMAQTRLNAAEDLLRNATWDRLHTPAPHSAGKES